MLIKPPTLTVTPLLPVPRYVEVLGTYLSRLADELETEVFETVPPDMPAGETNAC